MTAYATRVPLQLINNPHMMSEARDQGRRTSKRLEEKEDAPLVNGIGHENGPTKGSQKDSGNPGKAKVKGANTKPAVKRKQSAYDEEADGFPFTRTRAKRARAEPVLQSTAEEDKQESHAEPAPIKRSRKKSVGSPNGAATESEGRVGKRRSARNSGEHEKDSTDPPPLQVKKRRKSRETDETKTDKESEASKATKNTHPAPDLQNDHTQPIEITFDATKIALPFADTPRIQRNKDMRKTNAARRSSLGLRGRRASSLIDTGKSTAMPHDEVESSEFYKHIESEGLSEPRRMKQLLTWCGTRAMGDKPSFSSEDSNARLAAREIQNQLLKDLQKRSELSDWFNRNESTPPPSLPKPNPKNQSNLAKIQDLEQQIAQLRIERETWESLLRSPPDNAPSLEPHPQIPIAPSHIDSSLLSAPAQISALETLQSFASDFQPTLTTATSSRLQTINQNLEFDVDKFSNNVHALGAYKEAAERVADDILGISADALERRDQEGKARAAGENGEVGMRNVLRGLSRTIDR